MSITAVIEKGMIKLPKDVPWASGTVVRIEPVEEQPPPLLDAFKEFDGMADDLPADLAANLSSARPIGLAKGQFTVPDDFNAPLPEDMLHAFEGK
jgi:hypothetical protein